MIPTILLANAPEIDYQGLPERLEQVYECLKSRGLVASQTEFAAEMGVSISTYRRWIEDGTSVGLEGLARMHAAYIIDEDSKIDFYWLLVGVTETSPLSRVNDPSVPLAKRITLAMSLSATYAKKAEALFQESLHQAAS